MLFLDGYKQRLGQYNSTSNNFDMSIILRRLPGLDILESPFIEQEMDVVVAELPSKKLPGTDGSNTKFLKKCWHILKIIFMICVPNFKVEPHAFKASTFVSLH